MELRLVVPRVTSRDVAELNLDEYRRLTVSQWAPKLAIPVFALLMDLVPLVLKTSGFAMCSSKRFKGFVTFLFLVGFAYSFKMRLSFKSIYSFAQVAFNFFVVTLRSDAFPSPFELTFAGFALVFQGLSLASASAWGRHILICSLRVVPCQWDCGWDPHMPLQSFECGVCGRFLRLCLHGALHQGGELGFPGFVLRIRLRSPPCSWQRGSLRVRDSSRVAWSREPCDRGSHHGADPPVCNGGGVSVDSNRRRPLCATRVW